MSAGGLRGDIIRTVLCTTVVDTAQSYAHTYKQFLKLTIGLGFDFLYT